jgi:hypothetical protein
LGIAQAGHARAIETVCAIKAAGVNVGLIVLIGLGAAFCDPPPAIDVLNQMQLGTGDLLYFSDLVEERHTVSVLAAQQAFVLWRDRSALRSAM